QRDDAPANKATADVRPGLDDRACDCEPSDLRQLHATDPGFGLVVDAETLADVRKVDTDRGGLDEDFAGARPRVGQIEIVEHLRTTEAVVVNSLHRISLQWFGE